MSARRRLTTWKEIGSYIGRDARTAKRYETERGLPVRRMPGQSKSVVFAFSDEIDLWLRARDISASVPAPFITADKRESLASEAPPLSQRPSTASLTLQASAATEPAGASSRGAVISMAAAAPPLLRLRVFLIAAFAVLCVAVMALVVKVVLAAVTAPTVAATTSSSQALRDYQLGRYAWSHRNPQSLKRAADAFEDALRHDPNFAAAYTGLADCYLLMPEFGGLAPAQAYPKAKAAAERALALNPRLADAHRALGFVSFYWDQDVKRSDREFQTALHLDPASSQTHHWYANTLATRGEHRRAQSEIGRASALDPTNTSILSDKGWILMMGGDLVGAKAILSEVEAADPAYAPAHRYMGDVRRLSGDDAGMLLEWSKAADLTKDRVLRQVVAAGLKALPSGRAAVIHAIVDTREQMYATGAVSPFQLAAEEMLAGRPDQALAYLQTAARQRDPAFLALNTAPEFFPLRHNARFQRLQARAAVSPPPASSP